MSHEIFCSTHLNPEQQNIDETGLTEYDRQQDNIHKGAIDAQLTRIMRDFAAPIRLAVAEKERQELLAKQGGKPQQQQLQPGYNDGE